MQNNTPIILILLSIGLFYTFTDGQYQEVKKLNALANEYRGALQSVAETEALRDSLVLEYRSIPQVELDRINKILPDSVDNVQLALDLDSMAARYGISIKDIQATTAASGDTNLLVLPEFDKPYDKVTVSFSFIASHENFMSFLSDLEKSLRIMDIKSVSFQSNETDLYQYNVSVETYWLKKWFDMLVR